MQNQKKYILKGNVKNPSWELRNKDVYVKKSESEGLRLIQFVPGATSIWKTENEKQGKPKALWFIDGSLLVNKDDKIKIEFIEKHPDYNKHFELFDPESKAAAEFEKLELVESAKEMLRKIADDEDKMAATAASLFGVESMAWQAKVTKLRCYKYAEQKPRDLINALEDPAAEANYIAALAMRKGIVMTNPQRTAVTWAEGGVICPIPAGQKPLQVLGKFLYSEDNIVTLQELGNRLDELSGNKPKGKKKAAKEAA